MTYSEIIAELIIELGESGAEGDELTSLQADLLSFIKAVLRRFPSRARSLTLSANTGLPVALSETEVSLPNDCGGLLGEPYYVSSGSRIRLTKDVSFNVFNDSADTTQSGTISRFMIQGKKLKFNCKSDAARTVYIDYVRVINSISNGTTFDGTDDMVEVLKDGVKAYYAEAYSEDSADNKMALFRDGLDSIDSQFIADYIGDYVEEA